MVICYTPFVTISNDLLIQVAIFILAASGFLVASHIYRKKRKEQPLICPIKFDCNTVVNSDYSKFFGIPVEILGMLYYALIALSYLFLILMPSPISAFFSGFLLAASTAAFLFSVYLMLVLLLILRKGCSWCFLSAILCTLIFTLSAVYYNLGSAIQVFTQ